MKMVDTLTYEIQEGGFKNKPDSFREEIVCWGEDWVETLHLFLVNTVKLIQSK